MEGTHTERGRKNRGHTYREGEEKRAHKTERVKKEKRAHIHGEGEEQRAYTQRGGRIEDTQTGTGKNREHTYREGEEIKEGTHKKGEEWRAHTHRGRLGMRIQRWSEESKNQKEIGGTLQCGKQTQTQQACLK